MKSAGAVPSGNELARGVEEIEDASPEAGDGTSSDPATIVSVSVSRAIRRSISDSRQYHTLRFIFAHSEVNE